MRDTRQLRRLLALSDLYSAPITLAVVSMRFDPSLVARVGEAHERVTVCVHGADHRSRAAPGEPKSEFPSSRDATEALDVIEGGWDRLRAAFGERAIPVLAPPWNRVSDEIRARLPERGLGLSDADTVHIDPIRWSGRRSPLNEIRHRLSSEPGPRPFAGRGVVEAQIRDAPTRAGLMTHHRAHDAACWRWLDGFLSERAIVSYGTWLEASE